MSVLSAVDQKRKTLIHRLSILVLALTAIYIFLDWLLGIHVQPFVYGLFFLNASLSYFLNRSNKLSLSKWFGLLFFNTIIFLVSSSEPFETGIHLHFVAAGAVALALFGYEEYKSALFFAALSITLYLIVFLTDISFINFRSFTQKQSQVFFVINTLVSAIVSIYSFMLFSRVNYNAEAALRRSEQEKDMQNEQLKKTNQELDRFVYSVSHDLRAPLSSITGLIQIYQLSDNLSEKDKLVGMMQDRVAKLDKFIHTIIDYSRNARSEITRKSVNLHSMIEEIWSDLSFMPGWNQVQLQNNLPPHWNITSDEDRLRVVLSNLISNAIVYRNDRTERQPFVNVKGWQEKGQWVLQLSDNGRGISEEHLSHIFEMFYRAHRESKGSGLGLYIVKETLDRLKGTITCQSTYGEGTLFSMMVPD
jgi:signal transduction histidine kinase